jgi:hypothetical protein
MSSTINMNIVLSQGNAVKEVQSVKHQNLELNQILVSQHQEKKKDEEKGRVQQFEDTEKVIIDKDGSKNSGQEAKSEHDPKREMKTPERNKSKEHIVDIVA